MVDYAQGSGKQYHIGVGPEDIGKYVILPGDPGRVETIAKYLDDAHFVASNREFTTWTGTLEGEKVSVVSTGIGGPSTAIAVEELVRCGVHTFLRQGTCGGIDLKVEGGDVVVASGAVRAEGTSREYAPIEYPAVADFDVVSALKSSAVELGYRCHVGVVQAKDSFYGQHEPSIMPVANKLEDNWEAWKRMGCLASEMESATLFIVGQFRRVRCGALFLAIANQEREKAGLTNNQVHDVAKTTEVTINAVRKLIIEDKKAK